MNIFINYSLNNDYCQNRNSLILDDRKKYILKKDL